jgi:tRNA pseudouridine38-40 synthase
MRWKCICAYDGGPFAGWQSQAGGNAIQDKIEARLLEIFKRQVRVHGSGRTDAGVHAHGQVFHFDADWKHGAERLLLAMRVNLPREIQLKSLLRVPPTYHARFGAVGKRYRYRIHIGDADPFVRPYCWPISRELNISAMEQAAAVLSGLHDFRAFTVLNGPAREDTVRDLRRLSVVKRGRDVFITAEANGFLYKMVRSLVGVIVAVGEGRLAIDRVPEILANGKRSPEVQTAPPQGLFLMKVFYGANGNKPAAVATNAGELIE